MTWNPINPLKPIKTKCNCLILPNGIYLSSSYIYYNLYFVTINNFFYKSNDINSKIGKSFVGTNPSPIDGSSIPISRTSSWDLDLLSWYCIRCWWHVGAILEEVIMSGSIILAYLKKISPDWAPVKVIIITIWRF